MVRPRVLGAFLGLVVGAAAGAASCSKSSAVALDQACSINSDCDSQLVCAFGRCHDQCKSSRDCASGERCVVSGSVGVCQLTQESMCAAGTPCEPGEVCGADLQCRVQCTASGGCVAGDYCVTMGASDACYSATSSADEATLIAAGVLSPDGSVLEDASSGSLSLDGSASTPDGSNGAGETDGTAAAMSDAGEGGSTGAVTTCPTPQTQFGSTAQGDSNPNFTSGVGVRTATQLLIFSGYAGGGDAGDAGTDNLVYVQAFDPTTANSLGPAQPLFAAPTGAGFVLESASVAPTGEIALAFNYGGSANWASASSSQTSLYAAFLGNSADAGPAGVALQRAPIEIESAQIEGQPHVIWSKATGAFVFSWVYVSGGWFVGTKNFLPNGQAAGGTDPVPSNQGNAQVGFGSASDQGSAAAGPNLVGVAFQTSSNGVGGQNYWPSLTILDLNGNQVGSAVLVSMAGYNWVTVGATAEGFVCVYDNGGLGVAGAFVPTSADAGAVISDAGFSGFSFTGSMQAKDAHAINDDTGGPGGVGVALLYANGLSFAYVNADGVTHVGPTSVIAHTYAAYDQLNISNFKGSFGLSLYSAASQSTQMAASGCQ
jgi:hypothetical protein